MTAKEFHITDIVYINERFGWSAEIGHHKYEGYAIQVWDNTSLDMCRDKAQLICDTLNDEWNEYSGEDYQDSADAWSGGFADNH